MHQRHNSPTEPSSRDLTVRLADRSDARALARLAALDSAELPGGALLVADLDGAVLAALPVEGGDPIADPFRPTAALVEMLGLRARQLRGEPEPPGRGEGRFARLRALARAPLLRTP